MANLRANKVDEPIGAPKLILSFLLDVRPQESSSSMKPPDGNFQQGWEEQGACTGAECDGSSQLLLDRRQSLAEAERLFDELTQEKLQVRHSDSSPHRTQLGFTWQPGQFMPTRQRSS